MTQRCNLVGAEEGQRPGHVRRIDATAQDSQRVGGLQQSKLGQSVVVDSLTSEAVVDKVGQVLE